VGVVRFELRTGDSGESVGRCSIALAESARGRGVGRHAISEGGARFRREIPVEDLEAWVLAANVASLRAFRAAGYSPVGEHLAPDGRRFMILRVGNSRP